MKNNNLMQNNNHLQMNQNDIVTINDCFFYNQKTEYLLGKIKIIVIYVSNYVIHGILLKYILVQIY